MHLLSHFILAACSLILTALVPAHALERSVPLPYNYNHEVVPVRRTVR